MSHTWNTLGAETRLARADDKVAAIIPVITRGAHPDTNCITCRHRMMYFTTY